MGRRRAENSSSENMPVPPVSGADDDAANPDNSNAAALAALDAARANETNTHDDDGDFEAVEPPRNEPDNMERETRRKPAAPRAPKSLSPILLTLQDFIDPAHLRGLAELDTGRTRFNIAWRSPDDPLKIIDEKIGIPFDRFAPDFLATLLKSNPTERMTVTVCEKDDSGDDLEPWTFAIVLPAELLSEYAAEQARRAAAAKAAAPAPMPPPPVAPVVSTPPAGVDPGMFMMMQTMQQAAATQAHMFQTMIAQQREDAQRREAETRALLEKLNAGPAVDKRREARERTLDMLEEELQKQALFNIRGDKTGVHEQFKKHVEELKEMAAIKEELGDLFGQEAQPDMMDKVAGFAGSPVGQHLVGLIFGNRGAAALPPAPDAQAQERLEAYG